jgi:hypothetical protein
VGICGIAAADVPCPPGEDQECIDTPKYLEQIISMVRLDERSFYLVLGIMPTDEEPLFDLYITEGMPGKGIPKIIAQTGFFPESAIRSRYVQGLIKQMRRSLHDATETAPESLPWTELERLHLSISESGGNVLLGR